MADVTITVRKNASYKIEGPVRMIDPEGNAWILEDGPIFLCRCGRSENKPFCDGTHKTCGFEAETKALQAAAGE